MNIYVESLKKIDVNYNAKSKTIKESLSADVVTEVISEAVKNGGNWWYEYAYRYEGGTNRFYYRLRPSVGIKDYKINKGDIIRIDHEDSSMIPSYVIAKEDIDIAFRPGKNQNLYSEDFRTGDWYRLDDEDLSGNTYTTHDQIKVALCVADAEVDGYGKLLIPYDEEKDTIDFSRIEGHEYYYSKAIFVPVNPDDNEALIEPYTFITEGIITDYISFQWKDGYNEPGSFTLALPASQETMDLLKEDRYLLIGESLHTMLIETVVFNNNLKSDGYIMQVSGRSIECILERRVAFPGQGLNTNIYKGENGMAKAIYDLVDHFFIHPEEIAMESSDGQKYFYYPERRIPFITIPSENNRYSETYMKRRFRASVNKTVSKDDLLKTISSLCKNEQLGFKIEVKRPYEFSVALYWEFSLYTGSDKSYTRLNKEDPLLLFSPTLGNVESVATTRDNTNYRNAIFCGVEKDSDGYIDLTRNGSEANYFNQKTGIDIVDKFNSGATSLITGAKNRLVSILEASEVCYTGIYFLALAASRKDKDYTATVTKIENAYNYEAKIIVYVKARKK